ncbi:hypothetical protein HDC91_002795 [Mucilaginibacter sp. AK015]|nr:hypothetical protein [Mucilaginibacter sp. AK015]
MSNRDPKKIAQLLFRINLLPSIIAFGGLIMLILSWGQAGIWDRAWTLLVGAGLIAQFLYFLQIKYEEFAHRKALWLYSIILNIVFLAYYLTAFIYTIITNTLQVQAFWVIPFLSYPLAFLIFSCKAIRQL